MGGDNWALKIDLVHVALENGIVRSGGLVWLAKSENLCPEKLSENLGFF